MDDRDMLSLVARLSRELDAEGVAHALTGSIAASLHGEPITSLDVDLVVTWDARTAERVAKQWERDLCADQESFRLAAEQHGIANLLHFPSGLKVDISALPDTPYYREVMHRRIKFHVPESPHDFWVVTPEDIILMKLFWRRDSRSPKQWSNALGVARIKGHALNWEYLRHWARELGIEQDLDQLSHEAGI